MSLRKAGYAVITAESGEDALDRVVDGRPSLVISDTRLPGIDGYEFCKRLKDDARWKRLPFIFLTQQEALQEKIRGLELGVEEYLTKPIFIKELMIRIKMVLQKKQREIFTDREGQTTFKGNLADMAVVDLIQTMEMGRKSGVAQFSGEGDRSGTIYFREGEIIDAEDGDSGGEDAIYTLLGWSEGSFVVEFQAVERSRTIKESNQGLLMEGMRRVDEWSRIRTVIPDLTVAMVQDVSRAAAIRGDLSPMQSMAMALMDGSRSVEDIRGALAMDDLEILTAVRQLVEMGGVRDPRSCSAHERVKLEDIPQPKAYGERVGRPAEEKAEAPEEQTLEAAEEAAQNEDELATTLDFGKAQDLPISEPESFSTTPTLSYGTPPDGDADAVAAQQEEPPVELPPEEMEEDGEEQDFPPMELPPEEMEEDGEVDAASLQSLQQEGEDDDLPPPIPPEETEEEDLPPIPEDAEEEEGLPPIPEEEEEEEEEEDTPPVAEVDKQATEVDGASSRSLPLEGEDHDLPPLPEEEEPPIIPDEDEEAAAIEDEEPPPQITAALTESTEELAGELTLLKVRQAADTSEPVYLLTPSAEGDAEKKEEPPAKKEEDQKEEATAKKKAEPDKPEPKASRKRGRKKKGKKTKKGKATAPAPTKPDGGEIIPFPGQPAAKKDDGPPAGHNRGGAEPAPMHSVAEAAAEAAARAGSLDPNEASINVIDEDFFNSDYLEDDLAAFDESLIVPVGPPSKLRMPALIIIGVALIGASITTYFLVTSPYIGDGPEHLRVDPGSLARQEEARRKAETARREAAEKEQAAFLSGKKPAKTVPIPPPAMDSPPLTNTPPPAPEPVTPPSTPEPDKPAPAPEPDKPAPAPEPDKPAPAPDTPPPAGESYDTLLAEGNALLKKYKKRNAVKKFSAAIKANPSGWEAMEQLALYNMELGRMGTAYKLAKKVNALNPDAPYAHLVMGGMLQERGKRSAARTAYDKFLKLCPSCRYAKDIRAVLKTM